MLPRAFLLAWSAVWMFHVPCCGRDNKTLHDPDNKLHHPDNKENSLDSDSNGTMTLGTQAVNECLLVDGHLHVTATHLSIHAQLGSSDPHNEHLQDTGQGYFHCNITVHVPSDRIVNASVAYTGSRLAHVTRLYDGDRLLYYSAEVNAAHPYVLSFSASMTLEVTVKYFSSELINLSADFSAVGKDAHPQLVLVYTSPDSGYVELPRYCCSKSDRYPPNMDSWVTLEVPADHVIMLSLSRMGIDMQHRFSDRCHSDVIRIYLQRNLTQQLMWELCHREKLEPVTLETDALKMQFVSDAIHDDLDKGLRLTFTFHNYTSQPRQVEAGGKWNCSVPFWSDFQQHFPCNLVPNCVNSEDEFHCQYTTDRCGPGVITLGNDCFLYLTTDHSLSWDNASEACSQRGGHLAVLQTNAESDDLLTVLSTLQTTDFVHEGMLFGLRSIDPSAPSLYSRSFQYIHGEIAHRIHPRPSQTQRRSCAKIMLVDTWRGFLLEAEHSKHLCDGKGDPYAGLTPTRHVLCELDEKGDADTQSGKEVRPVVVEDVSPETWKATSRNLIACPLGHVTKTFLACDVSSACWGSGFGSSFSCRAPVVPPPPSFTCDNGLEHVPFTLVCDFHPDCADASDETFCVHPPCGAGLFDCGNQQCMPFSHLCYNFPKCANSAHMKACAHYYDRKEIKLREVYELQTDIDANRQFKLRWDYNAAVLNITFICPRTHFWCRGRELCLPLVLRCNGVYDCPDHEDELDCDEYTCPGYFRCRGTNTCIHPDDVCDERPHCPLNDDELYCRLICPETCVCHGQAFTCSSLFPLQDYPDLRYLDGGRSGMTLEDVSRNSMLVYLNLATCGLTTLHAVDLPSLLTLDLSDNAISTISTDTIRGLHNLRVLSLAGNPLTSLFQGERASFSVLSSIQQLDISRVDLPQLNDSLLHFVPNLKVMNLSHTGVERIVGKGLQMLKQLHVVDLRGCSVSFFPRDVFEGLDELRTVYVDNYKLCCQAVLPDGFNMKKCHSQPDPISSCDNLFRSNAHLIFVFVCGGLALFGNLCVFASRVRVHMRSPDKVHNILVMHLSAADFLMGVYVITVGVADRVYQGTYVWNDLQWRHSEMCKLSGFVAILSREVSVLVVFLITLDRCISIFRPDSSGRLGMRSAHVACLLSWAIGFTLAVVPLLPNTTRDFSSKSSICLPLAAVNHNTSSGLHYLHALFLLNFTVAVLATIGQGHIYQSLYHSQSFITQTGRRSEALTIGRRVLTVVTSDSLCWLMVGTTILASLHGVNIPRDVTVNMAVVLVPINSALNPFLYALSLVLEKRRREWEERMMRMYSSRMQEKTKTTAGLPDQ